MGVGLARGSGEAVWLAIGVETGCSCTGGGTAGVMVGVWLDGLADGVMTGAMTGAGVKPVPPSDGTITVVFGAVVASGDDIGALTGEEVGVPTTVSAD
eukprot:scaffold179930_cov39-Prasinocladus_malaysianus.AAC.1